VYTGLKEAAVHRQLVQCIRADIPDEVRRVVRAILEAGWPNNSRERPLFTEIFTALEAIEYRITEGKNSSTVRAFVQSVLDEQKD
jgi:hypothetical protein